MEKALRIVARGLVQGVGFRPFVFRLASRYHIVGFVQNIGGSSAEIFAEGDEDRLREFLISLRAEHPKRMEIESLEVTEVHPVGYQRFEIIGSDATAHRSSTIPPDFSICKDCLDELTGDTRWRGYPLNSCVACGPRFSMMARSPYDRVNTSMSEFPLCPTCSSEYANPRNERRFHAQGISCPVCGPRVSLLDKQFAPLDDVDPISTAAGFIEKGMVIAVKGIGGFHLAALASDDDVVTRLRLMKHRPTKPFAVMALDLQTVGNIAELPSEAATILTSWRRPILLLKKRLDGRVSDRVAPNLGHVGVFLPYTALHYLLLESLHDRFAIMTSGNASDEPMCTDEGEAKIKLRDFVDYYLVHNRRIMNRVDDSVLRMTAGRYALLRRGRGYAPSWLSSPFSFPKPVVAFGAMLQNAGCVAFEDKLVMTQYIGDVDEYNCYKDLEKYLKYFINTYKIALGDSLLACDLHPEYPSTSLAEEWQRTIRSPLQKVQHHWAHLASVAAENGISEGEHIGIAIDGAGLGTDGTIWGGEVLRFSYNSFTRVGHLKPQKMPGGDIATTYPVRMLIGVLSSFMDDKEIVQTIDELGILDGLPRKAEEVDLILQSKEYSVPTTSLGRILDAISAMLHFCLVRSYEGEPAIVMEEMSSPCDLMLEVPLMGSECRVADTTSLMSGALEMLRAGRKRGSIAYAAQYFLGKSLGEMAHKALRRGEERVYLSGGASVNDYVVSGILDSLKARGISLITHRNLPPNDGCIALGQAVISSRISGS